MSCVSGHHCPPPPEREGRGTGQCEGRTIVGHGNYLGDTSTHTLRFSNFPNEETEVQETRCLAQEPSGWGGFLEASVPGWEEAGGRLGVSATAGFRAPPGAPVVPGTDSGL